MEYYLAIKKEYNIAILNNMDGPREYFAKWNKLEKGNTMWFHLYVNLKNKTNEQMQTQKQKGDDGRMSEIHEGD